jgi:hypothetical protein
MKGRFGVQDFPRQLPDRADITLICDPACLTLMSTYIREHHGREVQFERVGSFVNATLARAVTRVPSIAAGDPLNRE